jgi:hypothetical protein
VKEACAKHHVFCTDYLSWHQIASGQEEIYNQTEEPKLPHDFHIVDDTPFAKPNSLRSVSISYITITIILSSANIMIDLYPQYASCTNSNKASAMICMLL